MPRWPEEKFAYIHHVGFSGTRNGLSFVQLERLKSELTSIYDIFTTIQPICWLHHGDCLGADVRAHEIWRMQYAGKIWIHPPKDPKFRAFLQGDMVEKHKDYLVRNRDIVDRSDFMVFTPKGPEETRSGTWSTWRYAQKLGRPSVVIMPDAGTTVTNMTASQKGDS